MTAIIICTDAILEVQRDYDCFKEPLLQLPGQNVILSAYLPKLKVRWPDALSELCQDYSASPNVAVANPSRHSQPRQRPWRHWQIFAWRQWHRRRRKRHALACGPLRQRGLPNGQPSKRKANHWHFGRPHVRRSRPGGRRSFLTPHLPICGKPRWRQKAFYHFEIPSRNTAKPSRRNLPPKLPGSYGLVHLSVSPGLAVCPKPVNGSVFSCFLIRKLPSSFFLWDPPRTSRPYFEDKCLECQLALPGNIACNFTLKIKSPRQHRPQFSQFSFT